MSTRARSKACSVSGTSRGSMSSTSGRSSVMPVSTSTRASGWSMTWTQTGQRSPSTSNSATSSGVIVGGGTRPSCQRPRRAYPAGGRCSGVVTPRRRPGEDERERTRVARVAFAKRLALNDLVDLEVVDRRRPVSDACLRPDRHHPFAPGLGLLTRVPYLEDSNLSVFANRRRVKHASSRWGIADTELLAHLVVLVGCDSRVDEPCCRHASLLARCVDTTPMRRLDSPTRASLAYAGAADSRLAGRGSVRGLLDAVQVPVGRANEEPAGPPCTRAPERLLCSLDLSRLEPRLGTFPRAPPSRAGVECCRAEGALRVQCRCVRRLGRVRRRVQLPLLELPCDDRVGLPTVGRDRAREAEGHRGCGLVDVDRRCPRRPREALREMLLAALLDRLRRQDSCAVRVADRRTCAQADGAHVRRVESPLVRDPRRPPSARRVPVVLIGC